MGLVLGEIRERRTLRSVKPQHLMGITVHRAGWCVSPNISSVHAFVQWRESLKKTCLDASANFITLSLPLLLHISVSPSSSFRHRVIYRAALPMEAAELQGQNGDLFAKQSSKLLIRLKKNFRNLCFQNHQGIKQMKCQIELFIHKFL